MAGTLLFLQSIRTLSDDILLRESANVRVEAMLNYLLGLEDFIYLFSSKDNPARYYATKILLSYGNLSLHWYIFMANLEWNITIVVARMMHPLVLFLKLSSSHTCKGLGTLQLVFWSLQPLQRLEIIESMDATGPVPRSSGLRQFCLRGRRGGRVTMGKRRGAGRAVSSQPGVAS